MTFLPVVERELRVASRRKSTYRVRILGTLAVLLLVGFYLAITSNWGARSEDGKILFQILSWISFAFVCFTGLLTSDAISHERREGTLGLLFLTDLRGYDIVLGKLMSNSLQVFYTLLAIFPVLGLPLLMGGVTGGEFWRTLVVLLNTLFFSVALGIFVSSISHDSQKALHATFLLIAFSVVAVPLLDWTIDWGNARMRVASLVSPGFAFWEVLTNSHGQFWLSLLLIHFVGWCFLALAIYFTPRLWQQKSSDAKTERRAYNQRFGAPEKREKVRLKLIDKNPVYWLALRRRWSGVFMKVAVLVVVGLFAWSLLASQSTPFGYFVQGVRAFFGIALGIWVTGQAARFFVEGWTNGALELLLCSPLTPRQIVQGQWSALKTIFLLPVILISAVQLIAGIQEFSVYSTQNNLGEWASIRAVTIIGGFINLFLELAALSWVGMWMGLTAKKQNIAVIKTYVFVEILPWFGFAFLQPILFLVFRPSSGFFPFLSVLITFVLSCGKNVGFILWAKNKLYSDLREIVSAGGKMRKIIPSPISIEQPPVISNPA